MKIGKSYGSNKSKLTETKLSKLVISTAWLIGQREQEKQTESRHEADTRKNSFLKYSCLRQDLENISQAYFDIDKKTIAENHVWSNLDIML